MENEEEKKQPAPPPDRAADAEPGAVEEVVAKLDMVAAEPEPAELTEAEEPALVRAAYEHPLPIRITHWVNAISLFVLVTSGLRIFRAFPSFGPKTPEKVLLDIPKSLTLGGWLG